jgi:RNase P subunit RPR2
MDLEDSQYICQVCAWEQVPYARARRCIAEEVLITCPKCGEIAARKQTHCVVPLPKGNYIAVTDPEILRGLNTSHKGTR